MKPLEGWRKILFGTEDLAVGLVLALFGKLDQIAVEFLLGVLVVVVTGNAVVAIFGNGKYHNTNGKTEEVKPQ
jgi:phosphotransferase system IIB component